MVSGELLPYDKSSTSDEDDEQTIEQEEEEERRMRGAVSDKQENEIGELEADNQLSLSDLMAKYGLVPTEKGGTGRAHNEKSDEDDDQEEDEEENGSETEEPTVGTDWLVSGEENGEEDGDEL